MTKKIELTLDLPTSINKLYINQYSYNPTTKTRVPTGKRIMGAEGKKVKAKLIKDATDQLKNQDWDYEWTKENFVFQDAWIYMNRKGRDDSNVYKLLNDSLEGIVYDNDSRVLTRTQMVLIDSEKPRVELVISQVEHRGIFFTQEHLDEFENTYCKNCIRYKRNCSILKGGKEGRVQESIEFEVDDTYSCSTFKQIQP